MILRFRTPVGTFRLTVDQNDSFGTIVSQITEKLEPDVFYPSLTVEVARKIQRVEYSRLLDESFGRLRLVNGDLVQLNYAKGNQNANAPIQNSSTATEQPNKPAAQPSNAVVVKAEPERFPESEAQRILDTSLFSREWKVKRERDSRLCRHGPHAMCDHCRPLEPYNPEFMKEKNIKHLSFHSFLRKLDLAKNKRENGSSRINPLIEPNYKVNPRCPTGHKPWPAGLCSKCQPSTINLNLQEFRLVDHVEFSTSSIMESFINAWRTSGEQRFGLLFGRYEEYEEVPLGIKAVVEAIYEPPQLGTDDGIAVHEWPSQAQVEEAASFCGLELVGIVFTDLLDAGKGDGSVVCRRHIDSYFLTSLEVIFSAKIQAKYPRSCRWSDSGKFGSNVVTCVVSGNPSGEISVEAYQASNSAVAMVEADLLEPCTEPSMMIIKSEEDEPGKGRVRYVPDVFYRMKNQYGITVRQEARPVFPVEYLYVSLTHGFPKTPNPMFMNPQFPIANRQPQEIRDVSRQLWTDGAVVDGDNNVLVSDFQLVCYLRSLDILSQDDFKLLCQLATKHDLIDAHKLQESVGWQTLAQIIQLSGEAAPQKRRYDEEEDDDMHTSTSSSTFSSGAFSSRASKRPRR